MKKTKIIFFVFILNSFCFSSEVYLEATKSPNISGIYIITKQDLQNSASDNLVEILKKYGVNTFSRSNIQTDVSLNGGTFEQIKIFIDGIPINDPQTGHHNLNIPLSLKDIESIQIIKNDNFSKYPQGAFCGAINIITKKDTSNFFKLSYGSFNTYLAKAHISHQNTLISLEAGSCSGFKENTDYNLYNAFYQTQIKNSKFILGVLDKKFGAQDFYTAPSTRKEYEHIRTIFMGQSSDFILKDNLVYNLNMFLRTGYDFYTTQRYNPQVYSNYHNSYVWGITNKFKLYYKSFIFEPLLEAVYKNLDSKGFSSLFNWKGMGEFFDSEYRVGINSIFNYHNLALELTFIENYYSRYKFVPQFGSKLTFDFLPKSSIFFIFSKLHRVPSYTELFYWDPAHQADENLKLEHTTTYQAGLNKKLKNIVSFSLAGFFYEPTNTIDWTRTKNSTQPWRITNIAKVKTFGGNLKLDFSYKNFDVKLYYEHILKEFNLDPTKELKYIENYPKNFLSLSLGFHQVFGFNVYVESVYKHLTKTNPDDFTLFNLGIRKTFKKVNLTLSVENLFDIKYEEIPGVQQPPRNIIFSAELNF
ncbi:MAG: TonB-dependent receptor plug domain-containing protein [Endomicrobiia bacterium]